MSEVREKIEPRNTQNAGWRVDHWMAGGDLSGSIRLYPAMEGRTSASHRPPASQPTSVSMSFGWTPAFSVLMGAIGARGFGQDARNDRLEAGATPGLGPRRGGAVEGPGFYENAHEMVEIQADRS